jgi:hypothetical protein
MRGKPRGSSGRCRAPASVRERISFAADERDWHLGTMPDTKMNEDKFRELVANWLEKEVREWKEGPRANKLRQGALDRVKVVSGKSLVQGWVAWPTLGTKSPKDWHYTPHTTEWASLPSKREIDVAIVLDVMVDAQKTLVPLFAIELKTGTNLNTDVLNMKSEIYARLRESYASVRTALIVADYGENRHLDRLAANARSFDFIFSEWSEAGNGQSRQILRDAVWNHLDYCVWYWSF